MRVVLLLTMVFIYQFVSGQIVINEFSASNATQLADPDFHDFADWIELYNTGTAAYNLNGYYITDNFNTPEKWKITEEVVIAAGSYLIIWADGKDSGLHTSYKLSASGEEIGLYTPGLHLLDSVSFSEQRTDISYGRETDGQPGWVYFDQATPNASNSTNSFIDFVRGVPDFSLKGGFYSSGQVVELSSGFGGEIRFTSDGSIPGSNSNLYTGAIPLNTTIVLRARIFKNDMVPGPTVTHSYFINENSVDEKLPVISIATEPENFWDPQRGIYVQNFKPLWEIPLNIELFENNGSDRAAFNEQAGAKVNGLHSWQLPQKMLGIYFRNQYGKGNLDYPILTNSSRNSYKSFALRASGSDWSYTLFRDMLGQHATLLNMDLDIIRFRPAVVYVNGEYLGIHNIREKVDDDYIEKSHQMDPGTFDLVENEDYAEAGDLDAYNHLSDLLSRDLSVESNYEAVAGIVDIENFTDYVITEMAVRNTSIVHNVMAWKPKESGKWKWVLMDVDRGFFSPTGNLISFYRSKSQLLLNELMENQSYVNYFGRRLADQLYTSFHPVQMNKLIEGHMRDIESEIPRQISRWEGTTSSYGNAIPSEAYWRNEVCKLKSFVETRPYVLLADLKNYGFDDIANLGLSVFPGNAGIFKIDGLTVPGSSWSGPYLRNVDIQLEAKRKPGFEFVGWSESQKQTIIPRGADWKYLDNGLDLGSQWTGVSYNDDSWNSGPAQLGYGDGDENTTLGYGGDSQNKFITTYFRKTFNLSEEEANADQYIIDLLKDDGAIIYLNGSEIIRTNMACEEVSYKTPAATTVDGIAESLYFSFQVDKNLLQTGENMIAVEIHQVVGTSSDISFDLGLTAYGSGNQVIFSNNNPTTVSLSDDLYITAVYQASGSCIIPEVISDDLTLSMDCSPYLVQGDIVVGKDATLTIEPGVEIWMEENANIFVHGIIDAIGTPENRIAIRLNPDYNTGSWGVISFSNTSQPSNLSYLTIEDASVGPDPVLDRAALSAFHADLILDNLTIENILGNPISARYADIKLTNSRLHSEVTGDLINVKYGTAFIRNCRFTGNDKPDSDGIDYDEIENGVIRNCQIYDFLGVNCDAIDLGEKSSNVLIDSVFVYNIADKGVSVGQRSSTVIQNSVFINCDMGVGVKDSGQAVINQCLFYNAVDAVASYEKNLGYAGGNVRVLNSILSNSSDSPVYVDSRSVLHVDYSLSDNGTLPGLSSNITGNPLFRSPTFFNFELLTGSPGLMSGYQNGMDVNMGTLPRPVNIEPPVMIYQIFINHGNLDEPEFIGIYNPGNEPVDLSNYAVTKGFTVTIPEGTLLNAGGILYITDNASATGWRSQPSQVLQWEDGKLSDNGEAIQLEESHGIVIDHLVYEDNGLWPIGGFSDLGVFQLIAPGLDNHFPENWTTGILGNIVSTKTYNNNGTFRIYPNPTNGPITLEGLDYKLQFAEIYNLKGQLTGKVRLDENGIATLDLSAYNAAMFIIKLGNRVEKVILIQ